MSQAQPHNRLVSVNPAAETQNSQRVDMTRDNQPDSGITMISAIRYLVCTQAISSGPADSPPPISPSEAATIWMSSSAMKKPTDIIANAVTLAASDSSIGRAA